MSVKTQKIAARLLKRNNIQKILQYWADKPLKWVQSCDLRREFVKKYQDLILQGDENYWIYFNFKTKKKYIERPKTLYNSDFELYRDLTDMVDCGILDHKKVRQNKGIPKSFYKPSMNYRLEPLKIWHKDCIMNTSIGNVIPIASNLLLYFSNESISIEHPSFTKKDIKKLNNLSNRISENLNEITDIFIEMGKRKAITICVDVIENFDLNDELKEFLYICIISDFATGLRLQGYDFSRIEKNSKEQFLQPEPAANVYNIIISAAKQFISKKYRLTDHTFLQLLEGSINYRNLHSFIGEIFRDFTISHSSYTIIGENPDLFRGNEKPLFSDKYISKFRSCCNLSDLDKLAKRIKKEKYLTPFEPIAEFSKIEHIFKEKQFESRIKSYLTEIFLKNQVIKKGRKRRQLIFNVKPSFFVDMAFLDEHEETIRSFGYNKNDIYNKLEEWATLFNRN